jgi:hypothetical protein
MVQSNNADAVADLLFGYAVERRQIVDESKIEMAHYTTADTAMLILDSHTMWLRNAAVMNDYSEIEHGRAVIDMMLTTASSMHFWEAIESVHADLSSDIRGFHNDQFEMAREKVFMTSLSEHDHDDCTGRLSMWRAYGGPVAGVALIFKTAEIFNSGLGLNLFESPILYGDWEEFTEQLNKLTERITSNLELAKSVPRETFEQMMCNALLFAHLSLKHRGFEEEREWRILHLPFDPNGKSELVRQDIRTVGGIPQLVYEIPFDKPGGISIPPLSFDNVLSRVLIGPCLYPETVRMAFVEKLRRIGVTDPEDRVEVSDIPLRQR